MAFIHINRGKTNDIVRYVDFSRSRLTSKKQRINISVKCPSEASQKSKRISEMLTAMNQQIKHISEGLTVTNQHSQHISEMSNNNESTHSAYR